ncbi:MAG: hypothetical protein ACM31C_13075 [Acidobacteriota bacterium]
MSRKRRRSRERASRVAGFTAEEEAFFAAGHELAEQPVLDDAPRAGWLRRLWARVAV